MPGVLVPERMRQVAPPGAAEAPPPGFIETLGAGFRTAKDDISFVQDSRLQEAYLPVLKALTEANGKDGGDYRPWSKVAGAFVNPYAGPMDAYDMDAVWSDIDAARAKNPALFQGLPKSRAEFEKQVLTRQGERGRDLRTVQRGSGVAAFVGGVGAMPFDPINIATAPFGGGAKTFGQALVREGLANALVEAVQQVPLASARERMGEELTAKEAALNVGAATVFGGLFGAGQHVIGKNWDAIKTLPKDIQEKAWAKLIEKSPALQARLGDKMDWDAIGDADLPDLAEAVIGIDNLSGEEKAAIAMMRREAEIEASNPFIADGAGIAAHRGELAAALERIMGDAPANVPRPRVTPASGGMPRLRGGTAISSGTVAGDAFAVVKSRIGIVESGGSNSAKNPRSSATGTYQFVSGTWVNLYVRRFGRGGLSDAQIAAKRADPRLQEVLMDDLMQANAKALRDSGHAADAGNLYLAHFAGSQGAAKILNADPNASVRSVLGAEVVDANPFLRSYSAADLVQWAHRKMGGKGGAIAPSRGSEIDPEAGARDWIQRELDAVEAERARLDEIDIDEMSVSEYVDNYLAGIGRSDDEFGRRFQQFAANNAGEIEKEFLRRAAAERPIEPAARGSDAPPAEVLAILPDLRRVVADRAGNASLSNLRSLSRQLGVDEGDLRSGLMALAAQGEIRMRYNAKGEALFARLPRDNGPMDILKFIARNGGLAEDGLDEGGRKLGSLGHALGKGGRDWDKVFVPAGGTIIRKQGRSVDDIGEALHEAGYFGDPNGPRPSESDILDAIEEAVQGRRKIYPFGQDRAPSAAALDQLEDLDREMMRRDFDDAARDLFDIDGLTDEEFGRAVDSYMRLNDDLLGELPTTEAVLIDMFNREAEAIQRALFHELEDGIYAQYEQQFAEAWAEAGFPDGPDSIGQARLAGDEGAGGTAAAAGARPFADEATGPIDAATYRGFDDPVDGPDAQVQVQSLEHDLEAAVRSDAGAQSISISSVAVLKDIETAVQLFREKKGSISIIEEMYGTGSQSPDPDRYIARYLEAGALEFLADGQAKDRLMSSSIRDMETNEVIAAVDEIRGGHIWQIREAVSDDMFGGPTQAEKRAALERRGEGGISTNVEQKPVGSDGGLFDPDSWAQEGFRLDAEGDVINPADLLAEFDAEASILKTIKDCL